MCLRMLSILSVYRSIGLFIVNDGISPSKMCLLMLSILSVYRSIGLFIINDGLIPDSDWLASWLRRSRQPQPTARTRRPTSRNGSTLGPCQTPTVKGKSIFLRSNKVLCRLICLHWDLIKHQLSKAS